MAHLPEPGTLGDPLLDEYNRKRNFSKTPEPKPDVVRSGQRIFVVQEHHASHLHWDLRLEKGGVLKSWAVPKGVPEEPGVKRLAVPTEDHPISYAKFEGTIPKGEYGAGTVKIWDKGTLEEKAWDENKIEIVLRGKRLSGPYAMIKTKMGWLLWKKNTTERSRGNTHDQPLRRL